MLCIQHRLSCKTILRSNVLIRHFRSRALQKPQVSGASLTVRNLFSLCDASLARACIVLAHFLPHRFSHVSLALQNATQNRLISRVSLSTELTLFFEEQSQSTLLFSVHPSIKDQQRLDSEVDSTR